VKDGTVRTKWTKNRVVRGKIKEWPSGRKNPTRSQNQCATPQRNKQRSKKRGRHRGCQGRQPKRGGIMAVVSRGKANRRRPPQNVLGLGDSERTTDIGPTRLKETPSRRSEICCPKGAKTSHYEGLPTLVAPLEIDVRP